jgi:hypothetical protein
MRTRKKKTRHRRKVVAKVTEVETVETKMLTVTTKTIFSRQQLFQ